MARRILFAAVAALALAFASVTPAFAKEHKIEATETASGSTVSVHIGDVIQVSLLEKLDSDAHWTAAFDKQYVGIIQQQDILPEHNCCPRKHVFRFFVLDTPRVGTTALTFADPGHTTETAKDFQIFVNSARDKPSRSKK